VDGHIDPTNAAQERAWDGTEGGLWAAHADLLEQMPARYDAALLDAAGVHTGARVLDVGCGTGEHALMAAGLGLKATGVDESPTAIRIAEEKARRRGLVARFVVRDALGLRSLDETFDTVLDCGLFHVFSDEERVRFVRSLRGVTVDGGRYHMLAFSDRQPGTTGPRRISQAEIRDAFRESWRVESIEASRIETNVPDGAAAAWLSTIVAT
jgi:cyclopropane fatty-acyl-phospholipid synthase-like methyltransferase